MILERDHALEAKIKAVFKEMEKTSVDVLILEGRVIEDSGYKSVVAYVQEPELDLHFLVPLSVGMKGIFDWLDGLEDLADGTLCVIKKEPYNALQLSQIDTSEAS